MRATPLEPATVERLAHDWNVYGSQYAVFSEVPSLSDHTILAWMDTAADLDKLRSQSLRHGRYRNVPGADRPVADFLPTGKYRAGRRRTRRSLRCSVRLTA